MNRPVASDDRIEIELNPQQRRAYDGLRERVVGSADCARPGVRQYLLLLPDLVVLLIRIARDSRVPLRSKLIALLAVGYVFSPIDLIPNFFGPIGLLDDLVVVVAALSHLLNTVHPDLIRQHWSGRDEILELVCRLAEWGGSASTKHFSRRLKRPFLF